MRQLGLVLLALAIALPLFATEPNPSTTQRAELEKLLAAMDLDKSMHDTIDAMYKSIEQQYAQSAEANGNDPDDVAEAKELFAVFRERAAKIDFGGDLHEAVVRLYAKYFNEKEIADLTAFYQSPTGHKAVTLMPQLMTDAMQMGAQHLSAKIQQAMQEAQDVVEKKRPWRRTTSDMRGVATALEAWATDHDETYPTGDYASLEAELTPTYIRALPKKDMWDHEYAYVVSDDHQHYRLVSAGADSIFEWDSRRIPQETSAPAATVYRDRLEDDLIYGDGEFIQLPVQAKPKQ